MTLKLEDAQEMARLNPKTFSAPAEDDLVGLVKGDNVMICVMGERFWIEIVTLGYPTFAGWINNDLVHTDRHGFRYGDIVTFEAKHIYKIYTGW